jgi:hypothetical protein
VISAAYCGRAVSIGFDGDVATEDEVIGSTTLLTGFRQHVASFDRENAAANVSRALGRRVFDPGRNPRRRPAPA